MHCGDLILGDPAFERWQAGTLAPAAQLGPRAVGAGYARLAEQAVASGVPGSSAAGEFPKFPALRELSGSDTPHLLVKFSGAAGSAPVQRWSDLLVCEHLALEASATMPGVAAARSRIVRHAGRTFLELERFDRHGGFGRSALVSLGTLDAALPGEGSSDWTGLGSRLHAGGLLEPDVLPRVLRLWWFGRLIANTDMHTGNLSFVPRDGLLGLAPAYDQLPMLYAPLPGGEVPPRSFEPPMPLPAQRAEWLQGCEAALAFWRRAQADERISQTFRHECGVNAERLLRVAERV